MIRRLKRQTKKRRSVRWPERTPRIRYRHNMTEITWWEAPPSFVQRGTVLRVYGEPTVTSL
jgi:hypothetical protein